MKEKVQIISQRLLIYKLKEKLGRQIRLKLLEFVLYASKVALIWSLCVGRAFTMDASLNMCPTEVQFALYAN